MAVPPSLAHIGSVKKGLMPGPSRVLLIQGHFSLHVCSIQAWPVKALRIGAGIGATGEVPRVPGE